MESAERFEAGDGKGRGSVGTVPTKPIVVLGAGCAGLAAGMRLAKRGLPVVILEKEDHVGGLAGGVHVNGNVFEYGPHTFHTTDPEILQDIKSLMGADLISYNRTIRIKFLGKYFRFPLSMRDVIFRLPPQVVLHAALSFAWNFSMGLIRKPAEENSETVLRRYYGTVLYEIFFKSYITRVWGIPPSGFSPAFARERVPRLSLLEIADEVLAFLKNRINQRVNTESYVEKVEGKLYTTRRGFSLIAQRMGDHVCALGGQILLQAEVRKLHREAERFCAVEYEQDGQIARMDCAGIVNTLPLNQAMGMISPPANEEILRAADELKFRALVFVGIVARRPRVLPSSFMYFRDHSFNRISDLAQFGFHIKQDGCTLLVAEISCDVRDRYWNDDEFSKEAALSDLFSEKLLRPEEVVETYVFRARYAYPIYTLHYETHRGLLLNAVAASPNLETAGRQGRFQYVNTHVAMKMGYEAADRLIEKLGKYADGNGTGD